MLLYDQMLKLLRPFDNGSDDCLQLAISTGVPFLPVRCYCQPADLFGVEAAAAPVESI